MDNLVTCFIPYEKKSQAENAILVSCHQGIDRHPIPARQANNPSQRTHQSHKITTKHRLH